MGLSRRLLVVGLAAAAALAAVGVPAPSARAGEWDPIRSWETATVSRIVDGDTMLVIDDVTKAESRIRFIGINAPEKPTKFHAGQCGWWQAVDDLTTLAPVGTKVRLASLSQDSTGRSNRPQRVVLAWDPLSEDYDIDLSWAMAERGWGIWFTVANEAAMSAKYRAVISGARERQVGLWNPTLCGEREQPDAQIDLRINRAPSTGKVNDEWVTVRNTGATTVDLTGWLLRNSDNTAWFTFPGGSVLVPGDYRVVHTGKGAPGTPDGHDLYAGARIKVYQGVGTEPFFLGDGAYLLDKAGAYRFWREYPCLGSCTEDPLPNVTIDSVFLGRNRGVARAKTQQVRIANWGSVTTCMDGAHIESGTSVYAFKPGVCIPPGGTWTLIGGSGTDTPTLGHWNKTVPALWATGNVVLRNDLGAVAATRAW